jgi:hypothetical protein
MHRSSQKSGRDPALSRRASVIIIAVIAAIVVPASAFGISRLGAAHRGAGHPVSGRAGHPVGTAAPADPASAQPSLTPSRTATTRSVKPSPKISRTPAATPTPTKSAAPPASPASATCTHPQFVTSEPTGGWADGAYFVYNNMWNASNYSVQQTLYACSSSNWYVVANMNNDNGDGAVKTYPNAHEDFSEPKISSFDTISSTFSEQSPHVGIYEDAYDIWLNGVASSGSTEVMVWTENYHQLPSGSVQATVTLDGRTYTVWRQGSYIAFVAGTNVSSGTVNLLGIFDWIMAKGWIPSTSTLGQIDYGAEIVSTGGSPATFSFTDFSVSTS